MTPDTERSRSRATGWLKVTLPNNALPSSRLAMERMSRAWKFGLISKVEASGLGQPFWLTAAVREAGVKGHWSAESEMPSWSASAGCDEVKAAVTVVFVESVTVHVPIPEQFPPDQPENVEPEAGVAVRVIVLPFAAVWVQVLPQLMVPPVIVPDPAPVFAVVRVYVFCVSA